MAKKKTNNSAFKAINQLPIKDKEAIKNCLEDKEKLQILVKLAKILELKDSDIQLIYFDKTKKDHMEALNYLQEYKADPELSNRDINNIIIEAINENEREFQQQAEIRDVIKETISELVSKKEITPDEVVVAKEALYEETEEYQLNKEIEGILENLGY